MLVAVVILHDYSGRFWERYEEDDTSTVLEIVRKEYGRSWEPNEF